LFLWENVFLLHIIGKQFLLSFLGEENIFTEEGSEKMFTSTMKILTILDCHTPYTVADLEGACGACIPPKIRKAYVIQR
jgi:hypothetical protein